MTEKNIPWWQVDFGVSAADAVREEVLAKRISMGPTTRVFEERIEEILNVRHCVATGSGTTALLMAMMALEIGSQDKVAIQDRSWISAAHASHLLNTRILLIDVMKESPILDRDSLAKIFEFNPKCIVVIHMNGRSSHIEEISAECKKRGIYLIEDAAQAIGSKVNNRFLGTFGDIGCFSLALTKTISSGQGGFCVTNDEGIFKRLRDLRSHGMSDVFFPEWVSFGMNFRFTDLQAALAITQLEDLAPRLDRQINIRNQYLAGTENLKNVQLLPMKSDSGENGPYFDCKVPDAKTFTNKMIEYGVQVRPFYPSLSTASYLNIQNRDATPNATYWHKHGVSLPSGPNLTNSQVNKVIEVLSKVDSSLQK